MILDPLLSLNLPNEDNKNKGVKGGKAATSKRKKGKQGFAALSNEERSRIAAKGGRAAHKKGTAHEWNSKEAAAAGRKGGKS